MPFDAIVIGSGFGGAITACRAAEKGMKVLVLERGRRWAPPDFPRRPGDAWLFNHRQPEKGSGWLDLRFFKQIIVAQGAGVGGGSLSYSSVALEAHPSLFERGWPPEISHAAMRPYYERAARALNLQTVPDGQLTQRFKLTRDAAAAAGHSHRFAAAPLAVAFSPDWNYGLADPFNAKHSRTFTNAFGQTQGTCVHLGTCDIGCDVRAKNTLDLNYIPEAERRGAEVRPLHLVRVVEPDGTGYRVVFDRIDKGRLVRGEERASRVFVAAGSLGSTELLLRCRDEHRTLPNVSRTLGQRWSANANVLTMARYADADRVQQTVGPTISAAIDFMDAPQGHRFVVEDDGFPNVLLEALRASMRAGESSEFGRALFGKIEDEVRSKDRMRSLMLWLGAGVDAADGEMTLTRPWLTPWRRTFDLRWKPERSQAVLEAIQRMHATLTEATGGRIEGSAFGGRFRSLLTLHPLGGCPMGTSADTGVVNHQGQVFGYRNLYVIDGAILPVPIGRNPSLTIAALAERCCEEVKS